MANTVDIQTIEDGPRNLVVRVYLASDGVTGDISNQVIVDASTLNGVPDTLKLVHCMAQLSGFTALLKWDATTDDELLHLSDGQNEYEMYDFGGIPNPKSTGYTGDVMIDTTGFTAAGDNGSIVLEFHK